MISDELLSRINSAYWWHQIELGGGFVTPGPDPSKEKFAALRLPDDMVGLSVIDIGAWNGYFSFECERRGAAVLATDHYMWLNDSKAGFDIAKEVLKSNVAERHIMVEGLCPENVGMFDISLFLGVLYHAPDPLGICGV